MQLTWSVFRYISFANRYVLNSVEMRTQRQRHQCKTNRHRASISIMVWSTTTNWLSGTNFVTVFQAVWISASTTRLYPILSIDQSLFIDFKFILFHAIGIEYRGFCNEIDSRNMNVCLFTLESVNLPSTTDHIKLKVVKCEHFSYPMRYFPKHFKN